MDKEVISLLKKTHDTTKAINVLEVEKRLVSSLPENNKRAYHFIYEKLCNQFTKDSVVRRKKNYCAEAVFLQKLQPNEVAEEEIMAIADYNEGRNSDLAYWCRLDLPSESEEEMNYNCVPVIPSQVCDMLLADGLVISKGKLDNNIVISASINSSLFYEMLCEAANGTLEENTHKLSK